ncbi:MAG: hypothetical protein H2174_01560 [Vampirovibrio sp.]|nr:hypothetical protein [Vampirovibrio sp.]
MKHPAQAFDKFILILFVFDYIFFALGNLIMTYSPDFSSASPASNWVAPPASIPSADYTYQPDAYAEASQSAESVYVPTAPLMQAPVQDVYSPPVLQPTVGTVSSADSYTPSFATPSTPEEADAEEANKPMPFMGKHPTQTLLATGVGALGGGLIGGSVKHIFFSGESDDAKSASSGKPTSTTASPKIANGWEFTGVHDDGITPKMIKNTSTGFTYEINKETKAVVTKDASGNIVTPNTSQQSLLQGITLGKESVVESETFTVNELGITTLVIVKKTTLVQQKAPHILETTITAEDAVWSTKTHRTLVHQQQKVALELNEKSEIVGIFKIADKSNLGWFQGLFNGEKLSDIEIQNILQSFPDAVLSQDIKLKFSDKIKKRFGRPNISVLAFDKLKAEEQQLLRELCVFGTSSSSNGYYPDFKALNAQCKFVPESVAKTTEAAKEAAEKAAKEIKWGELALPALAGASIVGAGVFVADFILQRRKPKATTAEPQGA